MTDQTPSLAPAEPPAAPPSDPRKQAIDALMRLAAGRAWHDIELCDVQAGQFTFQCTGQVERGADAGLLTRVLMHEHENILHRYHHRMLPCQGWAMGAVQDIRNCTYVFWRMPLLLI